MCVFVSRPTKIVTFLRKNGENPKRVVDFLLGRDTFRNKIMEIVLDFDEIVVVVAVVLLFCCGLLWVVVGCCVLLCCCGLLWVVVGCCGLWLL